ncbi:MAG TPA: hypothetical protein DEB73_00405 [Candidatus Magasanikbacteria bacterium]|uniref:Uncharacterized protein n=1 Tax=Candidatus Magasanikbacteria bacterium GW2011_GWC2_41_17 TaxID=1619048 RepID=A0A0G0V7K6_9BACT|nr:MAG: hypothetical protein UU49_C0037G0005 [Candidatus Magasanikbacteria bacterium GW2011_GWC2_41_17]HBV57730.1 hypothetical protein [Candidatus Magasanikbacteria bacterium]HBX16467.1 hypothetical protein [Candidatus Magasanikbacteria bacterium]
MPRQKTKKNTTKKIDFPTMFYREAPIEKIMANAAKSSAPIMSASDLRKRQIMMWSGVIVIMAFLIGLWGMRIKENFKNTGSITEDLNFLNKKELSDILKNSQAKAAEMKNLENIIKKAATNSVAVPTPAETLNAEQINELKKKIENKNTSKPL